MTMRIIEGGDYITATNSLLLTRGGWSLVNNWGGNISTTVRRLDYGSSFHISGNNVGIQFAGAVKVYDPYVETDTVFMAAGLRRDTGNLDESGPGLVFGDVDSGCFHLMVRKISFGRIAVYRATAASLTGPSWVQIGCSDPDEFDNYTWDWVEVKAYIHNSAGTCEVRLNGKVVLNLVSADTQNGATGTSDMAGFGVMINGGQMDGYVDDFAVWDDAGSTCNDWLGTNRIKAMLAIADGSNIDSTIGGTAPAATHWGSVRNTLMDDTKYVYLTDAQVGDFDLYQVDPVVSAPIVHALQLRVSARQDDATQMILRPLLKTGATTTEAADFNTPQVYNFTLPKFEINPATGVAFTQSEINAIEVGYKLEDVA